MRTPLWCALFVAVTAHEATAAEPVFPGIKKLRAMIPDTVDGLTKSESGGSSPKAIGTMSTFTNAKALRVHVSATWDEGFPNELNTKSFPDCVEAELERHKVLVCSKPRGMYRYAIWWEREGVSVCVGVASDAPGSAAESKNAATNIATRMLRDWKT